MRRRLLIVPALLALVVALVTAPARAEQKFLVFFGQWSAELEPAARDVVAAAVAYAKANPAMRVEIFGFSSAAGSQQANLYLSLLRAQLVSDMLTGAGIEPARLSRVAEGAVNAVGSEEESRRVEIVVRAR